MSAIAPGSKLGRYEIRSLIGAGGMGEVYRARDPELRLDVAIKVLPQAFSADPDRLRRFEQEALAAGSLNHPNLLGVKDVGSHDGARYVVTELLEGETLRDSLRGGALPRRRALEYAAQIAQGLAAAHDKGVVHRDLKPENVFVTRDGRVKILDFGLAKLTQAQASAAGAEPSVLPTPALPAPTEPGVVMGTVGYMSPEQVRGAPVDHRADIFSFGVVLYEMVTGHRAFHRDSSVETMGAILKDEPPELREPTGTLSPTLERFLRHCLEKRPEARFQSARDLAFDLETVSLSSSGPSPSPAPVDANPPRPRGWTLAAILGSVALASTAAALWLAATRPDSASRVDPALEVPSARFRVEPGLAGVGTQVAVHPSGSSFVFTASDGPHLWDLAAGVVRPIPQLSPSLNRPFFSSDGEWLGYMEALEVMKAPATGGQGQLLCYVGDSAGASWRGDRIVVSGWSGAKKGLWWIPSSGGELERLGNDPALANGVHPSFIEGRDAILFTGRDSGDAERPSVFDLSSGTVRDLGVEGSAPQYLSSGHLLWEREGQVWAAPFDRDGLRLTGDAVPVIALASTSRVTPSFAASANGTLVMTDAARSDLVEVAPDGSRRRLAVAAGELSNPRLSPDGRFLAYTRGAFGSEQLWIHELATGREIRIAEASRRVSYAVWTPGGDVVYLDRSSSRFALRLATPGRGGEPLTLLESDELVTPFSVSPSGTLLFTSGSLGFQVRRLDLARPQHAEVWAEGIFLSVMLSPDGRWVTYARWSEGAGLRVYVRSFQGSGAERPVSVNEGSSPMWSPDGRTIYFKSSSGLMAVAADGSGENIELGSPRAIAGVTTAKAHHSDLDYTPVRDGEGFIVVADGEEPRGFTVITNLGRMLRDRARAAGPPP